MYVNHRLHVVHMGQALKLQLQSKDENLIHIISVKL